MTKSFLNINIKKESRWKYIYCIIPTKGERSFGYIGIKGEEVYASHYKDIAAVVSNSTENKHEVFDEGVTHQKVVEMVQKDFYLIPMAFGQVSTEEDIKTFLKVEYSNLKSIFKKLKDKIELGLKVMWKKEAIMREIVASNDEIRILNKKISSKPKDRTYQLRIELGKKVADELERRSKNTAFEIYNRLSAISVDSKENKLLSDEMILNAAFLVEKEKEEKFDEMVDMIEKAHGGKVNMKYVRSAPYNFVDLRIK